MKKESSEKFNLSPKKDKILNLKKKEQFLINK